MSDHLNLIAQHPWTGGETRVYTSVSRNAIIRRSKEVCQRLFPVAGIGG
jgi:hypothetical protein